MIDRIRQFFLSIIGVVVFGFIFYLVFKDNRSVLIGFLALAIVLIIIILLVGLILRIRDNLVEKKRRKPFEDKDYQTPSNKGPDVEKLS